MAYSDPNSVHVPSSGTSPPAAWGGVIRDDVAWLAGDVASGNPKPMCRAYHASSQSIATATNSSVALDSERYDVGNCHSTTTNNSRLTVPAGGGGIYHIGGAATFASNATGIRIVWILYNGTTRISEQDAPSVSANTCSLQVSCDYKLAAGDYVELQAYQTSGGLLSVTSNSNWSPEFWFHWIGVG
jgi:hypothetical protein